MKLMKMDANHLALSAEEQVLYKEARWIDYKRIRSKVLSSYLNVTRCKSISKMTNSLISSENKVPNKRVVCSISSILVQIAARTFQVAPFIENCDVYRNVIVRQVLNDRQAVHSSGINKQISKYPSKCWNNYWTLHGACLQNWKLYCYILSSCI